ncbi:MAG TPA: sensor domain-containing diguanylate cyclase [Deltaproteobacteria bacterium]|nr:sensor domain-containing diguanylate cyclase [Deltaproteobacteria bacterium]
MFSQLFDAVDLGLVVLDKDLKVYKWNRWMELHSRISAEEITGKQLFDYFPTLNNPGFLQTFKFVLNFGNFYFFSQKLHHYLFPFDLEISLNSSFDRMQQSCNMGLLREEGTSERFVYIAIKDVTETAIYEQKLLEMNMKDGLTGIYNRRYLENRLQEEYDRSLRSRKPLSLIMFDIDYFKKINDTYGHQCGDHILQSISADVSSCVRKTDIVARYGGEEFCCLLFESPLAGAMRVAEQLKDTVADKTYYYSDESIRVTISGGVAELAVTKETVSELVARADNALYQAKRTGRNKIVPAS